VHRFDINEVTGVITVKRCHRPGQCIDYERQRDKQFRLDVTAADAQGEAFQTQVTVIVSIIDANDNAPVFTQNEYGTSVRENQTTFVPPLIVEVRSIYFYNNNNNNNNNGRRTTAVTGDPLETNHLFQRLSIAIQQANAVSFFTCTFKSE